MKLIVDTNVVLSVLIKGSKVRAILLSPDHQFYVPEHALEEIEERARITSIAHYPSLELQTFLRGFGGHLRRYWGVCGDI